jgi:PAS domain S-box-containing protein
MALSLVNRELGEYKKAITTSSIVSITNRKGTIEYANENFATLTGYSQSELIGSSHNIINSGYHPRSFWEDMWHTIMTGATWRGEVCNKKKNGDYYWVDSFIIPIKSDSGGIDRIFSIRIDITERKNKETEVNNLNKQLVAINRELTESKKELEKLSLVAKLTASEVLILNKSRQIIWVNDAFTRLTGYTLAEAIGKKPSELLHGPNSSPQTTQQIKDAIDNKRPFKTEVIHYSKTGEECCLLTDGQPVLDENGDLLQYVIVETDITELKQKQAAVRNSEIKLNAFFNTTANLHLLVDRDLNIIAFNKVAEDFMKNVLGDSIAIGGYLPPKLKAPIKDNFIHFAKQALEGNATINRQAEIPSTKGNLFWMVNYMPAYGRDGEVIGVAFTAVDITASKKAEAEINRQNAILKEIAWKQSHIVRAPLANILSLATLLEKKVDEDLRFALKHEAEKLDFIIRDIVDKTIEAKSEA